jgi:hypothetical protein
MLATAREANLEIEVDSRDMEMAASAIKRGNT